jgi:outer membrane protein TolC
MKRIITAVLLLVMLAAASSVFGADGSGVLKKYVNLGLQNNLALKQQEISLKKSLSALKEAKGMFLPSVSIEARYSRAGGGRIIEMPVGDLVNPLHETLNQLLMMHGYPGPYPANIENEHIPFLREEEHDTKLRVIQPVFQPAIYYNLKIKKDLTGIEKAKVNVFKRQLIADIKVAYFNYKKTVKVKKLLQDTRGLLEENLKISRSLFENHKRTEDVVFRSQAELSNLDRQQAEAEKNVRLAASYFNFLLNRPMDMEIDVEGFEEKPIFNDYDLQKLIASALERREEFRQLQGAMDAARHSISLHKSSILPTVSAVLDYGFQGEKYKFTKDDDYWMGSLVFSWNLFRGGQDAAKKKQAIYERKKLETQHLELENKIRLQVKEAYHNLDVAAKAVVSAEDALKSRREVFSIVSKKYREGMVPQIEYMKARNDFTAAGISHIIAIYDYYIKEAQLEQVAAYNLNKMKIPATDEHGQTRIKNR